MSTTLPDLRRMAIALADLLGGGLSAFLLT
jgi:hypothetical protein